MHMIKRALLNFEPRVIFINKLDRAGANPWAAIDQIRTRLDLNVAAVQV